MTISKANNNNNATARPEYVFSSSHFARNLIIACLRLEHVAEETIRASLHEPEFDFFFSPLVIFLFLMPGAALNMPLVVVFISYP